MATGKLFNVPGSVSRLYLLLHIQQGLSVRLQHGVQAGAEGPQVAAVQPCLIGVVLLVGDNTAKEQIDFRQTEALRKKNVGHVLYLTFLFHTKSTENVWSEPIRTCSKY